MPAPLLIVLSAPSGGGKTTLCQNLLAKYPLMTRAVTCTTRPPRPGERDGVDYYFLDKTTFNQRVEADEFLEHATVYDNRYGTLKSEVLDKLHHGRDVLLNVDVQGAAAVRAHAGESPQINAALVTIFLTTRDMATLEKRLRERGTESAEMLEKRLNAARQELARQNEFQHVVISGTREEDLRQLESIIEKERELRQR